MAVVEHIHINSSQHPIQMTFIDFSNLGHIFVYFIPGKMLFSLNIEGTFPKVGEEVCKGQQLYVIKYFNTWSFLWDPEFLLP